MKIGIDHLLSEDEKAAIVRECVEDFNEYLNRWPEPRVREGAVVEWQGEGCLLRDVNGREFIDCLGGFGIFALGHRHAKVIGAVKAQMDRLALHSQWMMNPVAADAARRLAEITPGPLRKTFWCSTGTEAVEGALKLARLFMGKHLARSRLRGAICFGDHFCLCLMWLSFLMGMPRPWNPPSMRKRLRS